MSSRQWKRPRIDRTAIQYDSVQLDPDDDYEQVHSREGRLKRVGASTRTAVLPRTLLSNISTSWTFLSSWNPPDDPEYALDPDDGLYESALESDIMKEPPAAVKPKKKKRSKVSKRPHVVWMELHRQAYLDEMLRWAGRADVVGRDSCPDCVARSIEPCGSAEYRCKECFVPDLTCSSCCVRRHRTNPFHRVEKWSEGRFTQVSLKSLGLKIQLNHTGLYCENPIPCHTNMLVLHTNGIHEVAIQYCGCMNAVPHHIQLLRRRLYPSSQISVKNCSTFELLRHLHYMALATKASTYDFYRALEKSTNNTGINIPKSRYRALLRSVLQWRHLKLLKRAGRGNDPTGVAGTKNGELAIRCPSCPWPGINLAADWETAPANMKFLYAMLICMDANFRLKNQLVSNYSQDPGLGIGWAYMVPRKPYEQYLLSQANEEDALAKANTKFSVGLRYTGVNAAVCGRSEMVLPLGVGNLPKGERYSSMDYIFGSVLQQVAVALVLISYDIACQWFVNLFKRISQDWPQEIKPPHPIEFTPAIPKLHYSMHETTNHEVYSLNYIPGAGLSDGECPERVWAPHNALGNSTKTQAPGSRQDVLDDHFNFWNWLKYVGMGSTLSRRYKAAVAERNLQIEGHKGLTAVLKPAVVQQWETMCVEWEEAGYPKAKKNPYEVKDERTWPHFEYCSVGSSVVSDVSEARVKKELAEEEERRLKRGGISLHKTSAPSFVALGLEIEETQRRIQRFAKDPNSQFTVTREGNLTEQRNILRTRLRLWEQLVPIYMPGLLQYQNDLSQSKASSTSTLGSSANILQESVPNSPHPEYFEIWLPSRVPSSDRPRVCRDGLPEIEDRLRSGQCHDALENVRQVLRLKARMIQFKNKNVRGQREGTRSRAVIDRVHERAKAAASRYRAGRAALLSLRGPGDWTQTLRTLEDRDIRGYQDPERLQPRKGRVGIWEDSIAPTASGEAEEPELSLFNEVRERRDGTGETRRTLSWIWLNARKPHADDEEDEILRSEWAKSRARAARGREEVMLLKEEMNRVLKYLEWKADWWRSRVDLRGDMSSDLREGLRAFALSQADVQSALAVYFRRIWDAPLGSVEDEPAISAPGTGETVTATGTNSSSGSLGSATRAGINGPDDADDDDSSSDSGDSDSETAAVEDEDDDPMFA
ncbi:hypothetical protein CVT26_004470 [Gymnopilus dilepis]|uniref:CxC2-like cysteine cluster KDZ transposase-associated domain-containing protein n=1 Tax=Gymnopilus dilepis TaxID=231916 RepID=A0A409WE10_9AGAR|nr:hypothetical protein CVT26_004470 [Gymnopilus dilepis]